MVRFTITMSGKCEKKSWQIDISNAFDNAPLSEEVYMAQSYGFKNKEHEDKEYRLNKALYGLEQA